MAGYNNADLQRANLWLERLKSDDDLPLDTEVAQLIVDVRNETIERCAGICDAYRQRMERSAHEREKQGKPNLVAASKEDASRSLAEAIRVLKDGANAHRPQVVTITPEEAAKVLVARLKPEDGAK